LPSAKIIEVRIKALAVAQETTPIPLPHNRTLLGFTKPLNHIQPHQAHGKKRYQSYSFNHNREDKRKATAHF
jgi:hypothetical protein